MNARANNSIPQGDWIGGWRIGPSVRDQGSDVSNRGKFRTLKTPGDFAPTQIPATWSCHLGLTATPVRPQCLLLTDSFRLSLHRDRQSVDIACVCIKKGVLLIEANTSLKPVLFTAEYEVHRENNVEWIDLPWGSVVLVQEASENGVRCCLVEREQPHAANIRTARAHMETQPVDLLDMRIEKRRRILEKHHIPEAHAPLVLHAMESLAGHLCPPHGCFTHRWSNADMDGHERMDLNQIYPLITAWCALDPAVAIEIFKTALSCQRASGFIPSAAMPDGQMDTQHAALPLFAQSALILKNSLEQPDEIKPLLPKLRNYLSWAITYYDPEGNGNLTWRTPDEALIEETFDAEVLSADLYALLLREIEAMEEIDEDENINPAINPSALKKKLGQTLNRFFWDRNESCFRDRFRNGDPTERITLSSFIPLLWKNLDRQYVNPMVRELDKGNALRRKQGLALWAKWEEDPEPAPVPAFHQLLMMHAPRSGKVQAAFRRLQQDVLKALAVQYASLSRITENLLDTTSSAEVSSLNSAPVPSALCIALTCRLPASASNQEISRPLRWLDRHRRSVLILAVLVIAVTVIGIALAFILKKRPPLSSIKASAALAEQYYSEQNYEGAIPIYEKLLKGGAATRIFRIRLGNAYLHNGNPAEAERCYRSILSEQSSPVIAMNLALALYRQGRTQEAAREYQRIIENYEEDQPALAEKARTALHLIKLQR